MSEALEAEQKTNPQGDPITSVAAPKAETAQGKTLMPKRNGRRLSRRNTCSSKPRERKSLLRAAKRRKRPFGAPTWILPLPIPSPRRAKRCSSSACSTAKDM